MALAFIEVEAAVEEEEEAIELLRLRAREF